MKNTWSIKEASKLIRLSEDTIRYYEKEHLISPKRTKNNYRVFTSNDLEVLKCIRIMKYAHFSIKEMKELLRLFNQPISLECNHSSRQLLQNKISDLTETIEHYSAIIQLLKTLPIPDTYEECEQNPQQMQIEILSFTRQLFTKLYGMEH